MPLAGPFQSRIRQGLGLALWPVFAAMWLFACSPEPSSTDLAEEAEKTSAADVPPISDAGPARLWPLGDQMLNASAMAAEELSAAIEQLVQAPDAGALQETRQHWHNAITTFEGFYVFTRLGLVAPGNLGPLLDFQYNIAAWPIQPGYLDSFGEHAISGLVFDIGVPLTAASLRQQHGLTDTTDVALGFYALQFLLFGEQGERGPLAFLPITELHETHREQGYATVEEVPRNRRRALMRLQAQMIANELAQLRSWWEAKGPGSPGDYFNSLPQSTREHLIHQATVLMLSEHLVAISEASQPAGAFGPKQFWQAQSLAERVIHQLRGWQQILALFDPEQSGERSALTQQAIEALMAIIDLPPVSPDGQPPTVNWQGVAQALSTLARHLRTKEAH